MQAKLKSSDLCRAILAAGFVLTASVLNVCAVDLGGRIEAVARRCDAVSDDSGGGQITTVRMLLHCAREAAAGSYTDGLALVKAAENQCGLLEERGPEDGSYAFEEPKWLGVANGRLGLLFKTSDESAELKAVYHAEHDHQFLRWSIDPRPLWAVTWYKAPPPLHTEADRAQHWRNRMPLSDGVHNSTAPALCSFRADAKEGEASVELNWLGKEPVLATKVVCTLPPNSGLSYWRIVVENDSGKGIRDIAFPIIGPIGVRSAAQRDYLAVPCKQGVLFRNPGVNADLTDMWNDSPFMQYMGYYTDAGSGLYLSAHNPDRVFKKAIVEAEGGLLKAGFQYPVEHMGVTSKTRHEYYGALGAFSGDWFDASMIYRDWALRQQWAPRRTWRERNDVPVWLKECHLSIRVSGRPEQQMPRILRLREYFGMPALLNWYQWHESSNFIEHGPEYRRFVWPGMKDALSELKSHDMHPVTYFCLRTWDIGLESWRAEGIQAAVKDPLGNPVHGYWGQVSNAVVDPGSKVFRQKAIEECAATARFFGNDGIYADLAGTFVAPLDFSTEHGHPPGGGTWLHDGQASALKAIRQHCRRDNPDYIVMAETCNELLLDSIDTHLTYHGFKYPPKYGKISRNVPMFAAVYGQHVKSYGSKGASLQQGPVEGAYAAQLFAFGNMLGRVFVSAPDRPPKQLTSQDMKFHQHLALYRQAAMPWLVYGKMVRPLSIEHDVPILDDDPRMDFSIETASWEAEDGSMAFVFVNTRKRDTVTFRVRIDPARYGIPADGSWELLDLHETGKFDRAEPITGPAQRTLSLKRLRALVLVVKPKLCPSQ